jgi:exonuclease VII large subunit
MNKSTINILIAVLAILAIGFGAYTLFAPYINSKREIVTDIINVDQVKTDCRVKINNLTAKMEQYRNAYSQYGLRVKELNANAKGSTEATSKINEAALSLIWTNKNQSLQETVKQQSTSYNNLVTNLAQYQQQYQGADQQLFREISQEIRGGRDKLEQIGNELISAKTDFKNYIERGSQIINIYQYNGCIPTARGTNNINDAIKWIDDQFFTPVSSAATETFNTKEDKPVI